MIVWRVEPYSSFAMSSRSTVLPLKEYAQTGALSGECSYSVAKLNEGDSEYKITLHLPNRNLFRDEIIP